MLETNFNFFVTDCCFFIGLIIVGSISSVHVCSVILQVWFVDLFRCFDEFLMLRMENFEYVLEFSIHCSVLY